MPNELTELDFSLTDLVGGQPLTLETVDLPTLRGFLEEVETLIKGDVAGASLADSRVRRETGSVKVTALVNHQLATNVREDMIRLGETGDLDVIQTKRAQIIERWQMRTRRTPSRQYAFGGSAGNRELRVLNTSHFQHGSKNAWISVERYLVGKVVNAGGKQDPNVHLVLADTGESVRVSATEQQLGAEKENPLYKDVTLRVQAEQHLMTKTLRDIRLLQFVSQSTEVDEQALTTLWRKGRDAWKDVSSASQWVEEMRGNH